MRKPAAFWGRFTPTMELTATRMKKLQTTELYHLIKLIKLKLLKVAAALRPQMSPSDHHCIHLTCVALTCGLCELSQRHHWRKRLPVWTETLWRSQSAPGLPSSGKTREDKHHLLRLQSAKARVHPFYFNKTVGLNSGTRLSPVNWRCTCHPPDLKAVFPCFSSNPVPLSTYK